MSATFASRSERWRSRLLPALLPVLILVLWELASRFGWLSNRVLPEPVSYTHLTLPTILRV